MNNLQDVDLTVMDAESWSETQEKINQIKSIIEEEWLSDDSEIMTAFDEAVNESIKNN